MNDQEIPILETFPKLCMFAQKYVHRYHGLTEIQSSQVVLKYLNLRTVQFNSGNVWPISQIFMSFCHNFPCEIPKQMNTRSALNENLSCICSISLPSWVTFKAISSQISSSSLILSLAVTHLSCLSTELRSSYRFIKRVSQ